MAERKAEFKASQEHIRIECRRIRESWSEAEHWERAGHPYGKPAWRPPVVSVGSEETE